MGEKPGGKVAESQVPKLDLMPVQRAEYNILAGCSPKCAGLKALNSTSVQSYPNKSTTAAPRKNTPKAHTKVLHLFPDK